MLTVRFHSSLIHRAAPRRGATALAPGARSVAPRAPPFPGQFQEVKNTLLKGVKICYF